ncbi:MAG: hypothetical protein ACTIA6_02585 [Pseudoclavibacter sp.]
MTIISSEFVLGALVYLAAAAASFSILVSERRNGGPARAARRSPKGQHS